MLNVQIFPHNFNRRLQFYHILFFQVFFVRVSSPGRGIVRPAGFVLWGAGSPLFRVSLKKKFFATDLITSLFPAECTRIQIVMKDSIILNIK